jgi:hypothetical protein
MLKLLLFQKEILQGYNSRRGNASRYPALGNKCCQDKASSYPTPSYKICRYKASSYPDRFYIGACCEEVVFNWI